MKLNIFEETILIMQFGWLNIIASLRLKITTVQQELHLSSFYGPS